MDELERVKIINQVVSEYFDNNAEQHVVAAKDLMPDFIKAGVFTKDNKKGLPIRKVLRALDEQNDLAKIPLIYPDRKEKNTVWYFLRSGSEFVASSPNDTGIPRKKRAKAARENSDDNYLINLCDEVLLEKASRQHRFDFLLGDFHKDGITRTALSVDAFYKEHNLVIELLGNRQPEAIDYEENSDRITASGITRSQQRKIYEERKRKGVLAKNINLIVIDYSLFESADNRLARDKEKDLKIIQELLSEYL